MKMRFLLASIVATALFALTPDVAAHGGWGGGGGWVGHGGGNWAGHGWGGHGYYGRGFYGTGFAFYGYPWWWGWGYPYYPYYPYPYPYYGYGAYYGNSDYGDPHYAYRDPSSSSTKWIQTSLARRGYYRGPIDGETGPATRNAIRSFQAHQGLPVTGQVDGRLVRALQS